MTDEVELTEDERRRAYHREWRRNNPDKLKQYRTSYRQRNPEKAKARRSKYHDTNRERENSSNLARHHAKKSDQAYLDRIWESGLKTKFGITAEKYYEMVESQQGLCAICHKPPNGRRLDVDHHHVSSEVRGLLCRSCNLALGQFKDDVGILLSAVEYLKRDK